MRLSKEQDARIIELYTTQSLGCYIIGNVQWVDKTINIMKGALSHDKFLELCKLVSNKQ